MSTSILSRLSAALSDRYRLDRQVGRGGMATVFLAEDLKHHRNVAIKVLGDEAASAIGPSRFLQEIRVTARLSHPNVLPLFDSGNVEDLLFYVTPYIAGDSLREVLKRGELPMDEAIRIAREIGEALDYAHRQGVIHRDIKPENILMQDGHALVADFGLARPVTQNTTLTNLTGTGVTVGTPVYMSPEQITGSDAIDGRTDQYSLACVLYEMLAGSPPFAGPVHGILYQHVNVEPPVVSTLRSGMGPELDAAIRKALAKRPADRFPGVAAFIAALQLPSPAPRPTAGGKAPLKSIAVLPLENLSGDPRQEYFADGMTDALIAVLGKLGALRVISRTSVMTYKGARKPLPVIARELNVEAIVEGTALMVGDDVRITVRLISSHDDVLIWSESYDRHLSDVFSLQGELARAIAGAVRIELTRTERAQLEVERLVHPDVFRFELLGKQALDYRSMASFSLAAEQFRQAIAIDPEYAPAHAGLAQALSGPVNYGNAPPGNLLRESRRAAERAIALDPMLHDAHLALALVHWHQWEWAAAAEKVERAIALNPGSAAAHHWRCVFLGAERRFNDAFPENQRAQMLDPLANLYRTFEGWLHAWQGRDDLAVPCLRAVLERAPLYAPALFYLGLALSRLGQSQEAIAVAEQAVEASNRLARSVAFLCSVQARAGNDARAQTALAELEERSRTGYLPPYFLAIAHGAVGNMDRAMEWLDRGVVERDPMMRDLAVDPACDPLRTHPHYPDVLHRMGLLR